MTREYHTTSRRYSASSYSISNSLLALSSAETYRTLFESFTTVLNLVILLMGYVIIKLPFTMRMTKAAFFSLDNALEDASKNLGAVEFYTFRRVIFPVILPTVMKVDISDEPP